MTSGRGIIYGILSLVGATTLWGSLAGWGVAAPLRKPISLREGSVHHPDNAHFRSRFVGGGLHYGK